jgi:hypothetical protein
MSNNEVFETIFKKVSIKIIDNNYKNVNIKKEKDGKYEYTNNMKTENLLNLLNNNVENISSSLTTNLLIKDKKSVETILIKHFESKEFVENIKKLTFTFKTFKKLTFINLKNIYYEHLLKNLMNNSVIEKIMALTPENNFKYWLRRRWKIVLLGYSSSIAILSITYYVFIYN